MFIHVVCNALNKAKIPYAIVGGYAVAFHGAIRGTLDVDIAIKWSQETLEQVENIMKELGLVSRIPVDASTIFHFRDEYIQNRHLIAWNFYHPANPSNQVDVLINYDLAKAHTKTVKTKEGIIKILAREDLIKMKKASGRPQDLEDIKALESL